MQSETWNAFTRALLRWDRSKVHPLVAIRNTAVVTLTLLTAQILHQPALGLVASLGALNVAYSDGVDAYRLRARRMLLASFICALAVFLGEISGRNHVGAVVLAGVWGFGAGLVVALGQTAADIGTISLVTLLVFGARPLAPKQAAIAGLLALAGGLVQTGVSLLFWPARRFQHERQVLAAIYQELARVATENVHAGTAPLATALFSNAREVVCGPSGDHSPESETFSSLMNQAERIRLRLLTLARLRRRFERDKNPALTTLGEFLDTCTSCLRNIASAISKGDGLSQSAVNAGLTDAIESAIDNLRNANSAETTGNPAFRSAMQRDAALQMDALAGQLRAAGRLATGKGTGLPVTAGLVPRTPMPGSGWAYRMAMLRANLNFESVAFRHGLRLAVCVMLGDAIARSFEWQRTYWIPMTIAIVLKPDFLTTFSRGALRLLGTFTGLVIATLIYFLLPESPITDLGVVTVFVLALRWFGPANYGFLTFSVSAVVVALIASTGIPPRQVIVLRGINTLLGGTLALIAYAVWPTWEQRLIGENFALLLDAYRNYLREIRNVYLHPEQNDSDEIDRLRDAARLARTNLEASSDRLMAEPGVALAIRQEIPAMLASSHDFIYAVMSLESAALEEVRTEKTCAPLLHKYLDRVELTLYFLSTALRGDPDHLSEVADLREHHRALAECAQNNGSRHSLALVETDRMTNALNTLREQVQELVKLRDQRKG
jgi:uncharacterized membrane protein YccC